MRHVLLALALALLAPAAFAGTWTGPQEISGIGASQWTFDDTETAGATAINTTFRVKSSSALVCFESDTAGAPAGTARVQLVYFSFGQSTANSANFGFGIPLGGANGAAALDGVGGAASTQNACIFVGPGLYGVSISVDCGAGDACAMTVQGQGSY